jgi:transcriptional regulator with XRE-family HTH domain
VIDSDRPVVGFRVGVFNWRLKKARERAGLTMEQLAERIGHKSVTSLYRIQALKEKPSESLADRIAIALETPVDELFPDVIDSLITTRSEVEVPLTASQVRQFSDGGLGNRMTRHALADALDKAVAMLPPVQRDVVTRRFGLTSQDGEVETLDQVAHALHLTRERVRQIEAKALRKLRHPNQSRPLLRAWEDVEDVA